MARNQAHLPLSPVGKRGLRSCLNMQRKTADGKIIIACDFTGVDWDERQAMIEGHRGSVISLNALARAIEEAEETTESIQCTMCLRQAEPPQKVWCPAQRPPEANPQAAICWDCIQQADRAFARDPEVAWERRIAATERWR